MNMTPTPRVKPLSIMDMLKQAILEIWELKTIINTRMPETKYVQPEIPVVPEEPDPTLNPLYVDRDNEWGGEVVDGEVVN